MASLDQYPESVEQPVQTELEHLLARELAVSGVLCGKTDTDGKRKLLRIDHGLQRRHDSTPPLRVIEPRVISFLPEGGLHPG